MDEQPEKVRHGEDVEFSHKVVEKEEARQILLQAIEGLPVHYRTVLTLFHLEEFSYREIEEITGMPEGTIKKLPFAGAENVKGVA